MGIISSFRPVNLLILLLTLFVLQQKLILIPFSANDIEPFFQQIGRFWTLIPILLIASGGYLINDYFDVEIDSSNQRKNWGNQTKSNRSQLFFAYLITTSIGIVLGINVSLKVNSILPFFVILLSSICLYIYSKSFKKKLIIGNIVVAFLTFLSVFYPLIIEQDGFNKLAVLDNLSYNSIIDFAIFIALFAFILTFIREIVKDIEDLEGDKKAKCKTVPIVYGVSKAIKVAKGLSILTLLFLVYTFGFSSIKIENFATYYLILIVAILLLMQVFILSKATTKKDFSNASLLLKLAMLVGISSILFY